LCHNAGAVAAAQGTHPCVSHIPKQSEVKLLRPSYIRDEETVEKYTILRKITDNFEPYL